MAKKPKNPRFPKKPKSSNIDTLERWAKKCEEIKSDYIKKFSEWKKSDDKKVALIKRGDKARSLK